MAKYSVPYGRTHIDFDLPETAKVNVIKPMLLPGAEDQAGEVARALDEALAKRPLPNEGDAVVVISDP
ncbi:MAG: hypothetical protein ACOX87_11175, partial [Chloroflexota bacterium]